MKNDGNSSEPPLWSIGIAMAIILLAPLVLYSLAPTGPIREGDTVFSEGQQRARFATPARDKSDETCLLDPNSPLIIVHAPNEQTDPSIIAEVQGNPSGEWPFCPVHTEVILETHQVFQKPESFTAVRALLLKYFGRG